MDNTLLVLFVLCMRKNVHNCIFDKDSDEQESYQGVGITQYVGLLTNENMNEELYRERFLVYQQHVCLLCSS
jgi:hypothetical protein